MAPLHEKLRADVTTACDADAGTGHGPHSLATRLHSQTQEWYDIQQDHNLIAFIINDVDGVPFIFRLPRLELQFSATDEGGTVDTTVHLIRRIHICRNIHNCIPSHRTTKSTYPYSSQHLQQYYLTWDA